jgi:glycosyltransferase involved in cell wall biosynthesis
VKTAQKLTAVVITHNVEDTIGDCLTALQKVADEILVLDSFSDDGTVEICRKMGVTLVPQAWLGYSATKNLGNSMARHDWILSIDADEVLSGELMTSLQNLAPEDGKVYAFDRLTNYCGKWIKHSGWYPDWKVRLFNRKDVRWQGDFVHETLVIPAGFEEIRLAGKLYHYSYKNSGDHLRRLEKYARLSAQEQFERGKKASFAARWLSPAARFVRTYFIKKGFLDGWEGWVISRRGAYMVRLRYRILRELWQQSLK